MINCSIAIIICYIICCFYNIEKISSTYNIHNLDSYTLGSIT